MPRRISIRHKLSRIDALILCGGRGRRLSKVIKDTPKPMAKVGAYPFLEILIDRLNGFGIRRFILASGYKGSVIEDYFRKHKKKGLSIVLSAEKSPLGTGGALKKAKKFIRSEPFFVLNGDSLTDFDPSQLLEFHRHNNALISIAVTKAPKRKDTGIVEINKEGKITRFLEKPGRDKSGYSNCGVYLCSGKIFKTFPSSDKFSLEYDYFPQMAGRGLYGYSVNKRLIDIGTPERYKMARRLLEKR